MKSSLLSTVTLLNTNIYLVIDIRCANVYASEMHIDKRCIQGSFSLRVKVNKFLYSFVFHLAWYPSIFFEV